MTTLSSKDMVIALRDEGLSYEEIANQTGISNSCARTIYSRHTQKMRKKTQAPQGMCRYCGRKLDMTPGKKAKQFCSDDCRKRFHNERIAERHYIRTCEVCHNEFVSRGNPHMRFCSNECRNIYRYGKPGSFTAF